MSNGYIRDIRQPDDEYIHDVLNATSVWHTGLAKLSAERASGKISLDLFWDHKNVARAALEQDLTTAHQNFLDRCHG
jgi:hypothetical protein